MCSVRMRLVARLVTMMWSARVSAAVSLVAQFNLAGVRQSGFEKQRMMDKRDHAAIKTVQHGVA